MKILKKVLCTILTGVLLVSTLLFGAACQNSYRGNLMAEQMLKVRFEHTFGEIPDKNDLMAVADKVNIRSGAVVTSVWIFLIVPPISSDPTISYTEEEIKEHNKKEVKKILDEIKVDRITKYYDVAYSTGTVFLRIYRRINVFDLKKLYKIAKMDSVSSVFFEGQYIRSDPTQFE